MSSSRKNLKYIQYVLESSILQIYEMYSHLWVIVVHHSINANSTEPPQFARVENA